MVSVIKLNSKTRASEMTEQVVANAIKMDDLSSVSRVHIINFSELSSVHTHTMRPCTHPYTEINAAKTLNNLFPLFYLASVQNTVDCPQIH